MDKLIPLANVDEAEEEVTFKSEVLIPPVNVEVAVPVTNNCEVEAAPPIDKLPVIEVEVPAPEIATLLKVGSGLADELKHTLLTAKHPVDKLIPLANEEVAVVDDTLSKETVSPPRKVEVAEPLVTKSCEVEAAPPIDKLPVIEVEVPEPVTLIEAVLPDPNVKVLAVSAVVKRLVEEAVVLNIVVPVALVYVSIVL